MAWVPLPWLAGDREEAAVVRKGAPQVTARGNSSASPKRTAPPELVVFAPLREFTCGECGGPDDLLRMENEVALCLGCADLDHLVYLGAGDAALTRRAKAGSTLSAVVVRFSRSRKRYERQGVLVEPDALAAAEASCLSDQDARQRRRERDQARREQGDEVFVAELARAIRRLFPGCPPGRAQGIAAHTGQRGSGRVGRTAAGRALDEPAIIAAVVASIRHEDTNYDQLLAAGRARLDARDQVRARIDAVLTGWRQSANLPARTTPSS